MAELLCFILSQYLWYNIKYLVDKISIKLSQLSKSHIHYVSQLFNNNDSIEKKHESRREYDLHENSYFQSVQLLEVLKNLGRKINFSLFVCRKHWLSNQLVVVLLN